MCELGLVLGVGTGFGTSHRAGDNVLATERAHALCNACELPPKALFVLPYSDHLFGFILRLETAFVEITQGYYLNECKRVKAHKDFANKNTHQQLLIRHQFKMGFLHELKQDPGVAIRHYKQAYVDLLELKTSDANILEVKTVAGILNYKVGLLGESAARDGGL